MKDAYVHELKCWPIYFSAIKRGDKTFEIRREDRERKFAEGDILHLREFEPCEQCEGAGEFIEIRAPKSKRIICLKCDGEKGRYTNSEQLEYLVGYIMRGPQFGLEEGWVIMSLGKIKEAGS